MNDPQLKFAIIGAGPSGLAMAKVFCDLGIEFEGFESSETVGGLWNFNNPKSPLYPNVHLISSRKKTQFQHFPMTGVSEDYPHHSKVFEYLNKYARHFDLIPFFRFNSAVNEIIRMKDEKWQLKLASGEMKIFDGVIIATGIYSTPNKPKISGNFNGRMLHSSTIKELESFKNRRVLIIGSGNSGCDLACDLSRQNKQVGLSMRSGNYIIPKYLLGKPADSSSFGANLPIRVKQYIHEGFLNLISGKMKQFGLPTPNYRIYEKHPIVNSEIKHQIGHGHIKVLPEVTGFNGKFVIFKDNTSKQFDDVILATGFTLNYPFLDKEHLNWKSGYPELQLNIFNSQRKNLYIIGLLSSLGLGWEGRYQQALIIGRYIRAKNRSQKVIQKFDRFIRKASDLSGGYNYKMENGQQYYVNNRTYLKYLKKGIKILSYA
ncbi:MAG: thioredoxin reductase [Arenicella sp.]|jgi:thioredoxin reductase